MRKRRSNLLFIAGPCVIEDRAQTLDIAAFLKEVTSRYPVDFIFKASYDKANRTSLRSFRGPGLKRGIKIIADVKMKHKLPVLSDVHCRNEVKEVSKVLDVIQIPAFLSRQTDLILAVAETQKTVNIKKAQFMSPYDIKYVIEKITSTGNRKIFLTERGTCFGYNNLVVDFRSFSIMQKFGYPVIFDVTHSLQRPSAGKGKTAGDREFVESLASAAVAAGVDGIFMEVHPYPERALSDASTSYSLKKVESLLKRIINIRRAISEGS